MRLLHCGPYRGSFNCTWSQFHFSEPWAPFPKSHNLIHFISCLFEHKQDCSPRTTSVLEHRGQSEPADHRGEVLFWVLYRCQCQYLPIAINCWQVKMESAVFQSLFQRLIIESEYPYGTQSLCSVSTMRLNRRETAPVHLGIHWAIVLGGIVSCGRAFKMYVTLSVWGLFYFFLPR